MAAIPTIAASAKRTQKQALAAGMFISSLVAQRRLRNSQARTESRLNDHRSGPELNRGS
jgi:hypothetical protein